METHRCNNKIVYLFHHFSLFLHFMIFQMTNQVKFHFQLPTNAATPAGLRSMLYLAQITHGLCLRQESEHYRRQRGILFEYD